MRDRPNVLFVFADQWRQEAAGFAGNPQVKTPVIDAFARQSVQFCNATSGFPVCSPYRASLLTGQYPTTHGVIVNDQGIRSRNVSIAQAFAQGGYDTAYIGKWHVTLHDRCGPIRRDEQMGFDFWRGFGCSHSYNRSPYYVDDDPTVHWWEGYDARAQTQEACRYIASRKNGDKPFLMALSWGPPHDPYDTAPEEFRKLYRPEDINLRANVPVSAADDARSVLAGYYAHVSALDVCMSDLLEALARAGLEEETIVVLTSDHGDMLGSHGLWKKQHPYDESVRVPWLMRWPAQLEPGQFDMPLGAPDIMPTLLGLAGLPVPETVEGTDFSPAVLGTQSVPTDGVLLACYRPFHEITYATSGRDYRGLRTERFTYCRDMQGPWLLFDNQADPFQMTNLVSSAAHRGTVQKLDATLMRMLQKIGDEFLSGHELFRRMHIRLRDDGDVYAEWNMPE